MAKKLRNRTIQIFEDGKEYTGTVGPIVQMLDSNGAPVVGKHDQDLYTMELTDGRGEITQYFVDGGLRGALRIARVCPGETITIKALGSKKEIPTGFVREYEIYGD